MDLLSLGPIALWNPIGRGASGEVWAGSHVESGARVAVKVMRTDLGIAPGGSGDFRREVEAISGLLHPHIVEVFEHGRIPRETAELSEGRLERGAPYLCMEFLSGGSLAALQGRLDWESQRAILLGLLDGLAHMHARGVIHRDVKPSNVLLDPSSRRWKLTDLGLAKVQKDARSGDSGRFGGTPQFAAPEQILGEWRDHGPPTDLYSLGCLAYALSTSQSPFEGAGDAPEVVLAQLERIPPPMCPVCPVPAGYEAWVARALAKDPTDRFSSAVDAARALLRLPATAGLVASPHASATSAPPAIDVVHLSLPVRDENAEEGVPSDWRATSSWGRSKLLPGVGLGLVASRTHPVVGRETERDQLWESLRSVTERRRAELVILHGPMGTGKSRLARWVSERTLETCTASVLSASHSPIRGPEDGIEPMLDRHFHCGGLSHRGVLARLSALLGSQEGPGDLARGLAELIRPSLAVDSSPVRFERPQERYHLIARALQRAHSPVVIWLDDVQWGVDSLEFIQYLLESQEALPNPVLLLATVQSEALAVRPLAARRLQDLASREDSREVQVSDMPEGDVQRLLEDLLGLQGALLTRLGERCGGNPLFALQLVRDGIQRGVLDPEPGGFRVREGTSLALPDDLFQVWATALDLWVPAEDTVPREGLELAAVLGRRVVNEEWAAVCERAGFEVPWELVDSLEEAGLVRRDETGESWGFVHSMLQESIQRLSEGRSLGHHRLCAEVLVERGASPARVGAHLFAAEAWEDAVEPLVESLRVHRMSLEFLAASESRGMAALALEKAGIPEGDRRHAEFRLQSADLHRGMGEFEEAIGLLEWFDEVDATDTWSRLLGKALSLKGSILRLRGRADEALVAMQRAVSLAKNLGEDDLLSRCLVRTAWVWSDLGRSDEAQTCLDDGWDLVQRQGDERQVPFVLYSMARLYHQQERHGESERALLEAERAARRQGSRLFLAQALNGLGEVSRFRGDLAEAEDRYREASALGEAIGSAEQVYPLINLGSICAERERFEEASAVFRECAEVVNRQGLTIMAGPVSLLQALGAAGQEDWAEWDRSIALATQRITDTGYVDWEIGRIAVHAGDLAQGAGESERACKAFGLAQLQFEALGDAEKVRDIQARVEAIAPTS